MPNQSDIIALRMGAEYWHTYRSDLERRPDLSYADLERSDYRDFDFSRTELRGANLKDSFFRGANFSDSNLSGAGLECADLTGADLRDCIAINSDLTEANLTDSNLDHAVLHNARLVKAVLFGANLHSADLRGATMGGTNCATDLSHVQGLDSVVHEGPSFIPVETLLNFGPKLPVSFLRGCGLFDEEIEYFRSRIQRPFKPYSCYISYSHADTEFAERLYTALQSRGVRCWLDRYELAAGDKIDKHIDEAIRAHDKILLCASENSLRSWWIEREIEKALDLERRRADVESEFEPRVIVLDLDGYIVKGWEGIYKQELLSRRLADFRDWMQDASQFESSVEELYSALLPDRFRTDTGITILIPSIDDHLHYAFDAEAGQRVELTLNRPANVQLMDGQNYESYTSSRKYRYRGGYVESSPFTIMIPSSGTWHIAVDLGGRAGTVNASARLVS